MNGVIADPWANTRRIPKNKRTATTGANHQNLCLQKKDNKSRTIVARFANPIIPPFCILRNSPRICMGHENRSPLATILPADSGPIRSWDLK